MTIQELLAESHRIAVDHGFDAVVSDVCPEKFSEKVLLMVGELVEAMEEFRAGRGLTEVYCQWGGTRPGADPEKDHVCDETCKPEGIPIELADCVIRIADFCASNSIDLEEALRLKMKHNETRPMKHGKNF